MKPGTLAFLTEATCGEACWHAREEICRCSCGGKNHGILNAPGGERPTRTSRIDGHVYELAAVGMYNDLVDEAMEICRKAGYRMVEKSTLVVDSTSITLSESTQELAGRMRALGKEVWWSQYHYAWSITESGAPARIKTATLQQVAKWPELTAWNIEITPGYSLPSMLWVRVEMPERPSILIVDKDTGLPLEDQLPRKRGS